MRVMRGVTDRQTASGQSAKQAGVSFCGSSGELKHKCFLGQWRHWNIVGGKSSLAASNQDTPWFSSSLHCQVKWGYSQHQG